MKKSSYRVQQDTNATQLHHRMIPVSNYQSTASCDVSQKDAESGEASGATPEQRHGIQENAEPEGSQSIEKPNADTSAGHNMESNDSQTARNYPFSLVRVWISITLVIVINILVVAVINPLLSQYLFSYFFKHDGAFLNVTNSTNSTSTCQTSTESENEFINEAQRKATNVYLYANIVANIPAFFVCLFAGSISDFLGRKFLLICSVSGLIIKTIILCIVIQLELDVQLIYIGAAIEGLMGSYFTTTLAVTVIIADVTKEENQKAVRFAIIEGLILVFGALAQLAVGYLIETRGYFLPTLICGCLLLVPLLAIIFLLPETLLQKRSFSWNIWSHIKNTFGFYFSTAGGKRRRVQFICGLVAYFIAMFTLTGKLTIEIFFMLTQPICWTSWDIGVFNSIRMVAMSVAAVIVMRIFKNCLPTEAVGVMCGVSSVGGFIFMGFADSTLLMYLSSLVGILYMATLIGPRAVLSQNASFSEQGALFSSMSCIEAIASTVSSTLYILIYNATLDTFKGATFIVVAGMCLIYTGLLGVMTYLRLSKGKDYENHKEHTENGTSDDHADGIYSSRL